MASTYPATASLPQSGSIVSRWRLDEASGNRADMVGSNTLTDNNTVTAGSAYTGSIYTYDNCALFTRANTESLSITDGSQSGLDLSGSFTISAWVKFVSSNNDHCIAGKWQETGNQRSYLFHGSANSPFGLNISNDGTTNATKFDFWNGTTTPINGVWYHVVAVYVASTGAKIYINGVDDAATRSSGQAQSTVFNGTAEFALGIQSIGSNFELFDGNLQDVIVWSVALSAAEVDAL